MRIIEKKCPNCGASLEFNENAKSCKCDYCKRSFEIERDNIDKKSIKPENFNLSELKGPLKIFSASVIIISIITFIIIGIVIFFIGSAIHKAVTNQVNGGSIYKSVEQFKSGSFSDFDMKAYEIIYNSDNSLDDFHLDMNVNRKNIYLAYKEGNKKKKIKNKNVVIAIYKAKYKKMLSNDNMYELYVPIVFENLKDSTFGGDPLVFQLGDGYVKAPEYYFNLEHSEYALGYQDMETLLKEIIEPLKKENYKITKK